jgi:hypothetical protein
MKQSKIYNALASSALICTALVSLNAQALDNPYTFGFSTVPDVELDPVTALNFGGKVALTGGTTCTLNVDGSAGNEPGNVTGKLADGSTTPDGANYSELQGAGCGVTAGTKGTAGVYKITGAAGVEVDITLTSQLGGTNFNFVPKGVAINYDGVSDGDTITDIAAGTATSVKLAAAGDITGNSGTPGVPISGQSLLFVGGQVQVTQTLLAGGTYQETFDIEVVYK